MARRLYVAGRSIATLKCHPTVLYSFVLSLHFFITLAYQSVALRRVTACLRSFRGCDRPWCTSPPSRPDRLDASSALCASVTPPGTGQTVASTRLHSIRLPSRTRPQQAASRCWHSTFSARDLDSTQRTGGQQRGRTSDKRNASAHKASCDTTHGTHARPRLAGPRSKFDLLSRSSLNAPSRLEATVAC